MNSKRYRAYLLFFFLALRYGLLYSSAPTLMVEEAVPEVFSLPLSAVRFLEALQPLIKEGDLIAIRFRFLPTLTDDEIVDLLKLCECWQKSAIMELAACEIRKRVESMSAEAAVAVLKKIDDCSDEIQSIVRSLIFTPLDLQNVLSLLSTERTLKRKVLCSALTARQDFLLLSCANERGGECEIWRLPQCYKEKTLLFEEPIVDIAVEDDDTILFRSDKRAWFCPHMHGDIGEIKPIANKSDALFILRDGIIRYFKKTAAGKKVLVYEKDVKSSWPYKETPVCLCVSIDGQKIVCASQRGISVFEPYKDRFNPLFLLDAPAVSALFHPDGIHAAIGLADSRIVYMNSITGDRLFCTVLPFKQFSLSKDGTILLVTGGDFFSLLYGCNKNIMSYLLSLSCEQLFLLKRYAVSLLAGTDDKKSVSVDTQFLQTYDPQVRDYLLRKQRVTDLNAQGVNRVHIAAQWGDIGALTEVVGCLPRDEERKLLLDLPGPAGKTALMLAAEKGAADKVTFLLEQGASAVACDAHGLTACHAAVASGKRECVRSFIKAGVELDSFFPPLLHTAVKRGDRDMTLFLLEQGVTPDACDAQGRNALHYISGMDGSLVKLLLDWGIPIDKQDKQGLTPVHSAVKEGKDAICGLLMEEGADYTIPDKSRHTPLQTAIEQGGERVIQVLVNRYMADAHCAEDAEPIHFAAYRNQLALFRHLLSKRGAYLSLTDRDKNTPLHLALAACAYEVAEHIINLIGQQEAESPIRPGGLTEKIVAMKNCAHVTAIHFAVQQGYIALAQKILTLGGNVKALTIKRETPLHYAARTGQIACAAWLLEQGADIDAVTLEQETVLSYAIASGNEDMVRFLLERNVSFEKRLGTGETILYRAASRGKRGIVLLLLEAGADPCGVTGGGLRAADGVAMKFLDGESGKKDELKEIFRLLLEAERAKEKQQADWTDLHVLAHQGRDHALSMLCDECRQLEPITSEGDTPLFMAIDAGHITAMQHLLNAGARVDIKDQFGRTALHRAVKAENSAAIEILVDRGADLHTVDDSEQTPLAYAVSLDHCDCASCLIQCEARELCEEWHAGWSTLECARALGYKEYMRYFMSGQDLMAQFQKAFIEEETGFIEVSLGDDIE